MKYVEFTFLKDPENHHGELFHERRKDRSRQKAANNSLENTMRLRDTFSDSLKLISYNFSIPWL